MRPVAVIQDERVARRILDQLGLPARASPRGRTWSAAGQEQLARDDPDRYDGIAAAVLSGPFDVLSARWGSYPPSPPRGCQAILKLTPKRSEN